MRLPRLGILLAVGGLPSATAAAQSLPWYRPINPVVTSRSALGTMPLMRLDAGWQISTTLDYGSLVEVATRPDVDVTLDMERLRLTVGVVRPLGSRWFAGALVPVTGSYAGFMDGALNWYHRLLGVRETSRTERPKNAFAYRVHLGGESVTYQASGPALDNLTLLGGVRHGAHGQTVVSLMLPTSTAGAGYRLGTVAGAVTTTVRSDPLGDRVTLEGSAGVGVTPAHGALAESQNVVFASASGGTRVRFWGRQSVYGNLFWHSPIHHDTGLPALDGHSMSLELGFLFRAGGGPEIQAGLVEDLYAVGPAVDLTLRLGLRW